MGLQRVRHNWATFTFQSSWQSCYLSSRDMAIFGWRLGLPEVIKLWKLYSNSGFPDARVYILNYYAIYIVSSLPHLFLYYPPSNSLPCLVVPFSTETKEVRITLDCSFPFTCSPPSFSVYSPEHFLDYLLIILYTSTFVFLLIHTIPQINSHAEVWFSTSLLKVP